MGLLRDVAFLGILGVGGLLLYRLLTKKDEPGSPEQAAAYAFFGEKERTPAQQIYLAEQMTQMREQSGLGFLGAVQPEEIPLRGLPGPGQVRPFDIVLLDLSAIGDWLGITPGPKIGEPAERI